MKHCSSKHITYLDISNFTRLLLQVDCFSAYTEVSIRVPPIYVSHHSSRVLPLLLTNKGPPCQPRTLHWSHSPEVQTLHPKPCESQVLNPKPQARNPQAFSPKPGTQNLNPKSQIPKSLNPKPINHKLRQLLHNLLLVPSPAAGDISPAQRQRSIQKVDCLGFSLGI